MSTASLFRCAQVRIAHTSLLDAAAANGLTVPSITAKSDSGPKRSKRRPGPAPGVARYGDSDRALFPELEQLMKDKHLLALQAANELAEQGKVAGHGQQESRARRLANLYRKEKSNVALKPQLNRQQNQRTVGCN